MGGSIDFTVYLLSITEYSDSMVKWTSTYCQIAWSSDIHTYIYIYTAKEI